MNFLRISWYLFCKNVLVLIPDSWFSQFIHLVNHIRLGFKWHPLNFRQPKTFNDKVNELKLKYRNTLAPIVADKVSVRDFVKEKIGEQYLVPIIDIFDSADKIILEELPNSFVIKANHGSGWNLICLDKTKLDWEIEKKKLNSWLSQNAYYLNREWQYKSIKPLLICEELLGNDVKDYKVFCFDGKPKFIQVDSDRFSNHERSFFDLSWNELDITIRYPRISKLPPPPPNLKLMFQLAERLSNDFPFCRIDLYNIEGEIFFGEITLHPGGGVEPFGSYSQALEVGNYFNETIV